MFSSYVLESWQHKGLKKFFETGSTAGIQFAHKERLKIILLRLNSAIDAADMNTPGMRFHKLKGKLKEYYSVTVNGNRRVIYRFENQDAILVNYIDYH
ncbi:MAG: type II toxin-antitoxin system RelE/ParE family toxin [Proteobacteria bacterium]|nr:type II toxin-antitoxin system RelE/ParE family toxin [Pseudomonadota bacterium]